MKLVNIWNFKYLNCGEWYEDMIDHRSYTHNLSSCVHNCDDQSYLHIILRSSNIWTFIYALVLLHDAGQSSSLYMPFRIRLLNYCGPCNLLTSNTPCPIQCRSLQGVDKYFGFLFHDESQPSCWYLFAPDHLYVKCYYESLCMSIYKFKITNGTAQ